MSNVQSLFDHSSRKLTAEAEKRTGIQGYPNTTASITGKQYCLQKTFGIMLYTSLTTVNSCSPSSVAFPVCIHFLYYLQDKPWACERYYNLARISAKSQSIAGFPSCFQLLCTERQSSGNRELNTGFASQSLTLKVMIHL